MKKTFVFVGVFLALASLAYADSREEKIERLMQAQGLLEIFQQQMESGKIEGEKQARKILDQITSQVKPNEEYKKKFEQSFFVFMGKIQNRWTAKDIVEVWASYYGPRFSEEELDRLIEFYSSPLGQKEKTVSQKSLVEFTQYFREKNNPVLQEALQEYLTELKIAANESLSKK